MNPAEKRLAIRTEDHPLDYATFEGVIPEGQYGAGTVMVWDLGTYAPLDDRPPEEQLAGGKIDIVVLGEKLRGDFTLVRTGINRPVPAEENIGCSSSIATSTLIRRGASRVRGSIALSSPAVLWRKSKTENR